MPSISPSRSITAFAAAVALGLAGLGATAGPPIDDAVATTVPMPCNTSFDDPPSTTKFSLYGFANATGSVDVEPPKHKTVEVKACLNGTGEPAKARYLVTAIKAPKSARYVTAVLETSKVFRDGTTRTSAASIAAPSTEAEFNRWLRRTPKRVELKIPGIGNKVYVSRGDILTTIAKRQNGKRISDDQRAAAAKALLADVPEPAPTK